MNGWAAFGRKTYALPDFETISESRLDLLIRRDSRPGIEPLLRAWAGSDLPPGRPLKGGRGGATAFDVPPDSRVVLRPCRRGGLVSRFNRQYYFGFEPRPFREVLSTQELRQRKVPTAEILGAAVLWVAPGCYRGAVASRQIEGSRNLWQYLCSVTPGERERVCHEAASVTIRMHDAGAVHPDLNLQNYLVRPDGRGLEVLIIDCDGVRFGTVSAADRRAAFNRICRSIRRLDANESILTPASIDVLRAISGE